MIKLIVAYDKNFLIGKGDKLPWNIKEEFSHFKNFTLGKTILMGDVTFNGIKSPLIGRKTIILTKNKKYKFEHKDVSIETNYKKIVSKYENNKKEDIIICGGSSIYKLFLPFVEEMIISEVKGNFNGDVYFPSWNKELYNLSDVNHFNDFVVKIYKKK